MTDNQNVQFEQQARENLHLTDKRLKSFLKKAAALRRNLKLRRLQQQERQSPCMRSK